MRILINCERSGVIRIAARAAGHDAYSCDLRAGDGGNGASGSDSNPSPYHIVGDAIETAYDHRYGWDLMIAHPPCTYLAGSGLHWNRRRAGRAELTEQAILFARRLWHAPIRKIAIENPIGALSRAIGKPTQIIQPYQFGDDASKRTCLWLRELALLAATAYVEPRRVCVHCGSVSHPPDYPNTHAISCAGAPRCAYRERWANQTDSGQNRLGPKFDPVTGENLRAKARAETSPGIAKAMIDQWMNFEK